MGNRRKLHLKKLGRKPLNPQTIEPFPEHVNRQHFASWLSGFTDGEGCFYLKRQTNGFFKIEFFMSLRADDREALKLTQSFLGCGIISCYSRDKHGSNPECTFRVAPIAELHDKVLPHFESYPLLAKKLKDFIIWKQAVVLAYSVQKRRERPRWKAREKEQLQAWADALEVTREFDNNSMPEVKPIISEKTLFDSLEEE